MNRIIRGICSSISCTHNMEIMQIKNLLLEYNLILKLSANKNTCEVKKGYINIELANNINILNKINGSEYSVEKLIIQRKNIYNNYIKFLASN